MKISPNSQSNEGGSNVAGLAPNCIETNCIETDGLATNCRSSDLLVDRNYAAVYRYAYRMSGCPNAAEDIAQEVFIKAIGHLDQLREAEAELGWMLAITRREFLRWLRKASRPTAGRASQLEEDAGLTESVHEKVAEVQDWVQTALGQLNADAQVVLLMYYFEELSYGDIAQQLNIPIGTVMSRLSRARDHMRRILEREVEHG